MSLSEFEDSSFMDYMTKPDCAFTFTLDRLVESCEDRTILLDTIASASGASSTPSAISGSDNSSSSESIHQAVPPLVDDDANSSTNSDVDEIPDYIKRAREEVNENSDDDYIWIYSSDEEDEEEGEEDELYEEYQSNSEEEGSLQDTATNSQTHLAQAAAHEVIDISDDDDDVIFIGENKRPKPSKPSKPSMPSSSSYSYYHHQQAQNTSNDKINALKNIRLHPQRSSALPGLFDGPASSSDSLYTYSSSHLDQLNSSSRKRSAGDQFRATKKPKVSSHIYRVHVKTKKLKIKRPKLHGIPYTPSLPTAFCVRCKVNLIGTNDSMPLQMRVRINDSKYHCLGCARILNLAHDKKEESDLINWLLSGRIPSYDTQPRMTDQDIEDRLGIKRVGMINRQKEGGSNDRKFVTHEELIDLYYESQGRCAITGRLAPFHQTGHKRFPYWGLTIDHIIPLSLAKNRSWVWSKRNLQIMSFGLNQVKGNYDDEDVKRWYHQFVNANVVEV